MGDTKLALRKAEERFRISSTNYSTGLDTRKLVTLEGKAKKLKALSPCLEKLKITSKSAALKSSFREIRLNDAVNESSW